MTIQKFLEQYAALSPSRWHTPGHKGTLDALDITELVDESFPADFVCKAQVEVAQFYGAGAARLLTGGSSIGIKAAIYAAGSDVIAPASCHQALHEGATLCGRRLSPINTGQDEWGIPRVPTAEDVQSAMRASPSARVVYLESPDYYGRVLDDAVIAAVKDAGRMFFCDAAHGAHFPAHPALHKLSYASVADACNLSAHKTLDAYTQSAYLCINNAALAQKIDEALTLLGTTSPSYLLLAALQSAVAKAGQRKEEYERLRLLCKAFRNEVVCVPNDDFTRLVVDSGAYGLTGKQLAQALAQKGIYCERYQGNAVVLIASVHEQVQDFERLVEAIKTL